MANLKWLWSHIQKVKILLLLSIVLMVIETVCSLSSIWIKQSLIDDVLMGGHWERFWPILFLLSGAFVVYSVLFTYSRLVTYHSITKIRTSMCNELMNHMYRLPISRLYRERTATIVYHFTNDLQTCAGMSGNDLPRLAELLSSTIFIILIMGLASPKMLGGMICFSILYVIMSKKFSSLRKKASGEVNKTRSDLLVHLEEGVSATREIIAFHRHDWETNIYQQKFKSFFVSVMKEGKLINKQQLLSDPLKWGAVMFVLLYGGTLVLKGELSIGMFVVTYQFTNQLMDSFNGIYQFSMELSGKFSSVERVNGFLRSERTSVGKVNLIGPIKTIQFKQVYFQYQEKSVLNNLSFSIESGKKIAFVGSSGGGKSTIASLLVRFYEPSKGEILINEIPLWEVKNSEWMDQVTLVFQEPFLFPDTIRSNLLLGSVISEEKMIEICKDMLIHEHIISLPAGYDTIIGERGVTLSGGQRQRLVLARALLRDSEVLILDEATSALDLETERQIQGNLDRLRKNRTTLIIAHRLSTVINADCIVVMDKGNIVQYGTHDKLIQNCDLYRSLVQNEEEVYYTA